MAEPVEHAHTSVDDWCYLCAEQRLRELLSRDGGDTITVYPGNAEVALAGLAQDMEDLYG